MHACSCTLAHARLLICLLDDLFERSLNAELQKRPWLLELTEADVEKDPLPVLFNTRLKGYYKCRTLHRQNTLKILSSAKKAGMFFVEYKCRKSGQTWLGTAYLAHYFHIYYTWLHDPAFTVNFDKDGATTTTSKFVRKIQKCVLHPCMYIFDDVHMYHSPPSCRTVWSIRQKLARSVHDMSHQKYSNKRFAEKAWKPLWNYLFLNTTLTVRTYS